MPHSDEIPTDADVIQELASADEGLRPSELVDRLEAAGHSYENVVRAVQRVLDRGKAVLGDGGRFIAVEGLEVAA